MPLILRNRDIGLLWAGQALSQAGTRMYQLALAWWIVSSGGSGRSMGIFMLLGALPAVALVRLIGRTVERAPSKSILVSTDLASAAVAAVMAAALGADRLGFAGACAGGFVLAVLQSFFDPTLNKAVPELAAPEDLERAVALQTSTQPLASFAGAAGGALLIGTLGVAGVIWLNAASFLLSAGANALLRFPQPPAAVKREAAEEAAGFSVLESLPFIRKILICFGVANFFMSPILVVLPLYVNRTLAAPVSTLGLLEAALWLGLLAGTWISGRPSLQGAPLRVGAAALGSMGLALISLSAGHAPTAAAALLAGGAALGVNNVKFVALFQESVPASMKGRFFALMQAILTASFPVAFFAFGWLCDFMSPGAVCVLQGLGVLGVASVLLRLDPQPAPAGAAEAA